MLLLPTQKLALLFPVKTASQTLQARLESLGVRPYPKLFHFNPHLRRITHQHLTLSDWAALPEHDQGYQLAVFVRNPYDRVFSGFIQLQRNFQVLPRLQYPEPWIRERVLEQLARAWAGASRAGFDVNRWFQQLPEHEILDAGQGGTLCLHPCIYWTHRGKELGVDFLGKVEHFEADFDRLRARYGIGETNRLDANRSDAALASADSDQYLYARRLAPGTIDRINVLFRQDFDRLGYDRIVPPRAGADGVTRTSSA